MLKEIEIHFCKDIKENEKYNLINQPVIDHKQRKPKRKKVKVNNLKEQHIFNFNNFNVISTLSSSVELVLYSCSHRQSLIKIIHKSTKSIVTVPKNCLIVYNCGLYHGQKNNDEKDREMNIRMSFQLVNSSLYKDEHYKDEASDHICKASCDKCSEKKSQITYN